MVYTCQLVIVLQVMNSSEITHKIVLVSSHCGDSKEGKGGEVVMVLGGGRRREEEGGRAKRQLKGFVGGVRSSGSREWGGFFFFKKNVGWSCD